MSALDQPLMIANSNYHVGHQVAIAVAKEQKFFEEEGLSAYVYDSGGVIPGPLERDGLAMAMKMRGVDIATAVDIEAAIYQCCQGEDVYIVGGWRYTPLLKWYGSKAIKDMRGGRIGTREKEGLTTVFVYDALQAAGIDPEKDVEWVYDKVFGYRNNPAHADMLRNGKVDAITSQSPFSDQLEKDGFKMILDPNEVFPRRPGKITVATRQTIEQRGEELRAYLRAITRSFWFMRDVSHFEYLKDLEARLRKTTTHNEEELHVAIVTAPDRVDSWAIPVDGAVAADSVKRITDEMVRAGKLPKVRPVAEILRDDAVREAYQSVSSRPELKAALEIARAAEKKYGF